MLPPARRPALGFALLLVGLTAWVGCTASPSATASTPTPATPTATRAPATASPAPIFTATATARPTPVPLAVELATTLIAPYAPDYEPRQTPDGLWRIRFTTPEGQTVELQDVRAEGRSMEPQDWVENYNHGQVLFEGTAEDGTLWRIVEQNGERMLMWDRQISYLSDIFPYILYSYDQETGKFQAYVEPPGNGRAEDVHLTWDAEQKVWVDEDGQAMQLTNFAQSFAEHYHLTEMDLQRITIDNWEVVALEDAQGRLWVVKEGGLYRDGEEVVMPEVVGEATPSSLARREEDGQWYVMDERGLARWVIEDGEVKKYRRPVVAVSEEVIHKWQGNKLLPDILSKIKAAEEQDFDYSLFREITIMGESVKGVLNLGIVRFDKSLGFSEKDGVVWVPGFIVDSWYDDNGGRIFVIRYCSSFRDAVTFFWVNESYAGGDTIYGIKISDNEWGYYKTQGVKPKKLAEYLQIENSLFIWYGASAKVEDERKDVWIRNWREGKIFNALKRQRLVLFEREK